ncbi:hypothetical protein JAAARDRAFT_134579 [Jaapia argillacea MUCL 33604]|uniref:Histone-lysine N-methyltransferase, H3 lysine-79 specific n=1 Tax=Jaapia argillacea MUCL 33604 TaxID=933084 RepID=A0A067PXB4_9AGAM|nr:hypothetical protein JAAARDRAFT_134579 [Jaapia argillacea MUCL 33604]
MISSAAAQSAASDFFFTKSKSSKPVASSSSSVVVTTRVVAVPRKVCTPTPVQVAQRSASPASSSSSLPPTKTKKRKSPDASTSSQRLKRSRPATPLDDGSLSLRSNYRTKSSTPSSSLPPSLPRTMAPTPEPIFRSSRSRSTSAFPSTETPVPRPCSITETGSPGPSFLSCEDVVKRLMRSYKAYFKNPDDPNDKSFDPHPTDYPVIEIEYPNEYASEKFILLAPKDKDHYNPIMCLEKTLYTIIECYLTPEQQALFGGIPTEILSDSTPPSSPLPSRSPSPHSRNSSVSSNLSASSSLTSLSSLSSLSAPSPPPVNYLRTIQRAIHKQDGPLFVQTVKKVCLLLQKLKSPPLPLDTFTPRDSNPLMDVVGEWSKEGIPKKVLLRIVDETYQRCVGPHVQSLKRYEAFSSEVYGELMPSLISDIITSTGLNPNSLFVDLGSGVGNVVLQASLQSCCRSFGIEILPAPARIAREQLEQFKIRCRMWGVSMGEVELMEGDMLKSKRVDELLREADVVLVNNKVFLEELNEKLRPKFLDLKEGAIVVSLKPFVSSLNLRLTERNIYDISTIFDVTERTYHSGSVSWGSGSGSYYFHRVDREGYRSMQEKFTNSRAMSRSSRSRR